MILKRIGWRESQRGLWAPSVKAVWFAAVLSSVSEASVCARGNQLVGAALSMEPPNFKIDRDGLALVVFTVTWSASAPPHALT